MKKKKDNFDEYKDVTVADMNVEGMPWYEAPEKKEKSKKLKEQSITKSEQRAMIKGAYAAFMPAFLIGLGVFCLVFGLIMLYFYLVM